MSRFISKKVKRISLSGGDWIDVRENISYDDILPITKMINPLDNADNAKAAGPLLQIAIVGWNLKDDEGKDVECTKENIQILDSNTVLEILPELTALYFPEKKN